LSPEIVRPIRQQHPLDFMTLDEKFNQGVALNG
jgi:hypothetical protein